jgi:hypothetical protein
VPEVIIILSHRLVWKQENHTCSLSIIILGPAWVFLVEFGGTGTFLGPEVDFEIQTQNQFECDKNISFINLSQSLTDPIESYAWSFGNRAIPQGASTFGPHDIC